MGTMTSSNLLYKAHGSPLPDGNILPRGRCAVCGELAPALDIHKYIKATFTNRDVFSYPNSSVICSACAFVLSKQGFRYNSYFCTEKEFLPFKREELSEYLLAPPANEPFICAVTSKYKKHLWLFCEVNYFPKMYMIRFEEINILFEPGEHQNWLSDIEIMYSTFSKNEIRTGNYYPVRIEQFGEDEFREYELRIKEYRRWESIFEFILYMANKKEELCPKKNATKVQTEVMTQLPKKQSSSQLFLF